VKASVLAIVGTVGLPANYGGFETLVENLVVYQDSHQTNLDVVVYCSSKQYSTKISHWLGARLRYIPLNANGAQSIPYDCLSLLHAVYIEKASKVLVLGVSGAFILPFLRLCSRTTFVTNIDGLEWKRDKWKKPVKLFLRFSEYLAVRFSHQVVSDNDAIAEHVKKSYGSESEVIAYGGDHAVLPVSKAYTVNSLPEKFYFAVCRIEKENNIRIILESFAGVQNRSLVLVGNWNNSPYGKSLKEEFENYKNINLLNPIYELEVLKYFREQCIGFVHGHSAGGTNPSLVEAMWFGKNILAFDCSYNRHTTENKAMYFSDTQSLKNLLSEDEKNSEESPELLEIAQRRYTWEHVAGQYFGLFHP